MRIKKYIRKVVDWVQTFLFKSLNALSFLMIVLYFGYIVYYSVMCYSTERVIVGCISLYIMIHLNKSL